MIKMSTLTLNKPPTYLMLTCVDIWLSTYLPPLVNVVFGRPLRATAASKEDSRPQAILKFQPCNSFDYRVRYDPQLSWL